MQVASFSHKTNHTAQYKQLGKVILTFDTNLVQNRIRAVDQMTPQLFTEIVKEKKLSGCNMKVTNKPVHYIQYF